jgi:fimbrial chaperone protein
MKIVRSLILSSVSVLLSAAVSAAAHAMTVAPMQVEMVSIGKGSRAQVSVVNNSSQPLPIEAVIQRMTVDEQGRSKASKADGEFLVMPPQALIPPGATQNFRVQWLGDPTMAESQSFLLFMNQIPVKLPQGQTGVQVVMSMGVMINVAPAQGVPNMKVVSTGVTTDKAGKRFPTLTVENTSQVHALMQKASIKLASGSWSQTLPAGSMSDRIGIGLVQPGKRRTFMLPVELPSNVTRVEANLSLAAK